MALDRATLLLTALLVCLIGPGLLAARRLARRPAEILPLAAFFSAAILYLVAWAVYLSRLPWDACGYATTFVSAALLIAQWRCLVAIARDAEARASAKAFTCLVAWTLLLLLLARHYAVWTGDFIEHYDRARFFLDRSPPGTKVYPFYAIPARPPLMNVVAALFLAQFGNGYDLFQLTFAVLNALAALPILLIASRLSGGRAVWLAAALLALSPWFTQNATYAWTKLLAAGYVALAGYLYFDSATESRPGARRAAAFVLLAAAILVHYSAAPFALVLGAHYTWQLARHRVRPREFTAAAILSAALLSTWVAWCLHTYGRETFSSTTTAYEGAARTPSELARTYLTNIRYTLVPRSLQDPTFPLAAPHEQRPVAGKVREFLFFTYHPAVVFAFGLATPLLAAAGLRAYHLILRTPLLLLAAASILALFTHTPDASYQGGIAHVVLQPTIAIGYAILAGGAVRAAAFSSLTPSLRVTWLCLAAFDAAYIVLHAVLQRRVFPYTLNPVGDPTPADPAAASEVTQYNYVFCQLQQMRFLGEAAAPAFPLLATALVAAAAGWWLCVRAGLRAGARGTEPRPSDASAAA